MTRGPIVAQQFCPRCGEPRIGQFAFCRKCGLNFDIPIANGATAPTPPAPPTAAEAPPTPPAAGWVDPGLGKPRPPWWKRRSGIAAIGVGAFLILGAVGSLGKASGTGDSSTSPTPASTPSPSAAIVTDMPTPTATDTPTTTDTPTPTPEPSATPTPTPAPTPAPAVYAKLTSRTWQLLVKSPDAHIGETYQVWACVTQFDSATGTETFRGQGSYARQDYWFTDGDNAVFTGDASDLSDVVKDDVVFMHVSVAGSLTYDTQIGGSTTVPEFLVDMISHEGSCG